MTFFPLVGPKDERRTIFFFFCQKGFVFYDVKRVALGTDYGDYRIVVNNLLRQIRFYQYLNVFDFKFMQTLSKTYNDLTLNP